MEQRKFNKNRYWIAFLITLAVFSIGMFFGFWMDTERLDYMTELSNIQELNYRSLQLQYQLISDNVLKDECQAIKGLFDTFIVELEESRERIEVYSVDATVKKSDFEQLLRRYTLSQINFWYISNKFKEQCPKSSDYVTIVYFHASNQECPRCGEQGAIMDYFKLKLKENVLIFAIDAKMSIEPTVELIKSSYNITSYPSLIIDNEIVTGFVEKEELREILCARFKSDENKDIICKEE
jgi:hypothetical protein